MEKKEKEIKTEENIVKDPAEKKNKNKCVKRKDYTFENKEIKKKQRA